MTDFSKWKIQKEKLNERQNEYSIVAKWCDENEYHIEEVDGFYKTTKNKEKNISLEEKLIMLEDKYQMNRWQREAILAENSPYSDFTKARARELEEIAEQIRG